MRSDTRNGKPFKNFLEGNRKLTLEERTAQYQHWRATVAFTDEQILAALQQLHDEAKTENHREGLRVRMEHIRRGNLNGYTLGLVMPLLITQCELCPRKALYRRGSKGRCKMHKDVPEQHSQARSKRLLDAGTNWREAQERLTKIERLKALNHRMKQRGFK